LTGIWRYPDWLHPSLGREGLGLQKYSAKVFLSQTPAAWGF
jgi:hypothetical protein